MKTNSTISIPAPCHQNWNSMLPNEQGKFCGSCQKNVIDFSALSNKKILELLANTTNVCGRITETQLNGFNNMATVQPVFSWRKFSIAAAFIGFVSLIKAEAKPFLAKPLLEQGPVKVKVPLVSAIDTAITYKKIFGKVTEVGDTLGIPGVSISIKGTQLQTVTNAEGKYSLDVPVMENCILVTRYIGYDQLETRIEVSKPSQQFNLALKISAGLMGEIVVITRPPFVKRIYNTVTHPVRKIFRKKAKMAVAK